MQRLITIRRHMDSHEKPYKCPYPKCQRQRHVNGFSRQDNLQVHIDTFHEGKGKVTRQLSRVVKKQRIISRRQGQMETPKIIMGLSRKLLKQLEGDDDADSVLADESSDEEDDELEDSCDYGSGGL